MDLAVTDLSANAAAATIDAHAALIERVEADAKDDVARWLSAARAERTAARPEAARALLREALVRFPNSGQVAEDLARINDILRDWPQAEQAWRTFMRLNPTVPWGVRQVSHALRQQGRNRDAEAALVEMLPHFPDDAGVFTDYARLAETQRDWVEADARWTMVVERFPKSWEAWLGRAWAHQNQGQVTEAEALLEQAQTRYPDEPRVFTDHARLAELRRDWTAAALRWGSVTARFPHVWEAFAGQARVLRQQGKPDDARTVLVRALERFPTANGPVLELARLAEGLQDWAAAERWWRILVALDPHVSWCYTSLATALRHQGQMAEAEALLRNTIESFAAEPGPRIAFARFVEGKGDWADAFRHWESVRIAFPDNLEICQGTIVAATRAQLMTEAERLLVDAKHLFPRNVWFFIEWARLFDFKRDWPAAEAAWRDAVARFPANPETHRGLVNAVREAGDADKALSLLTDCVARFPDYVPLVQQQASVLEARGDWAGAAACWRRCAELTSDPDQFYIRSASAWFNGGRDKDALEVLDSGIARLGNRPSLLRERGMLAERQSDRPEAVRRFRAYAALCPDVHDAKSRLANALWSNGELDEAEAVMEAAVASQPDVPELAIEFARFAMRRGPSGNPAYLSRARAAWERFPDYANGYTALADALRRLRRAEEAETILESAHARFPANVAIARRLAGVRVEQSKWDLAFAVFAKLMADFPPDTNTMSDYVNALIAARRWDEAERLVNQSLEKFPTFLFFHMACLDIAIGGGHLEQAAALFDRIQRDFGNSADARRLLFERRGKLLDLGVAVGDAASDLPILLSDHSLKIEDLVTRFESLGGAGIGCEFGQFQRHYGAEPLGLLRWSDMKPDRLADALETGFEGVGRPEQTVLEVPHGEHHEYVASDRRYGMVMHTFVAARSVPYDKMYVQICRRLTFLRDKLLADLREARKIFVYKNALRTLDDAEVERIHTAIRQYGDTALLYVRRENAEHPCPTVIMPKPGLLIGHIDRFELLDNGVPSSLPARSWAAIAANAYSAWQSASSVEAALS